MQNGACYIWDSKILYSASGSYVCITLDRRYPCQHCSFTLVLTNPFIRCSPVHRIHWLFVRDRVCVLTLNVWVKGQSRSVNPKRVKIMWRRGVTYPTSMALLVIKLISHKVKHFNSG